MPEEDAWPRCPQCGARRVVRCPICHTSGTDFPPADAAFRGLPPEGERAGATGCSCGAHSCRGNGGRDSAESPAGPGDLGGPCGVEDAPPMLVCPTCDEPLVPEYPKRCEWCGHEFEDGYDPDSLEAAWDEPLTGRAVAVIIAMAALGLTLLAYFLWLV